MSEHKQGPDIDHPLAHKLPRASEPAAEVGAEPHPARHDSTLASGPALGLGRGLPDGGGPHHPGDDDGCVENSYRD